jgi:hypothetical protein
MGPGLAGGPNGLVPGCSLSSPCFQPLFLDPRFKLSGLLPPVWDLLAKASLGSRWTDAAIGETCRIRFFKALDFDPGWFRAILLCQSFGMAGGP